MQEQKMIGVGLGFDERLNFGQALELLKVGHRVARAGWNGKGMWIALSPGSKALPAERFWAPQNRRHAEENGPTDVLPCITMKTATGEILMGWLASQTDMLAEDWEVVLTPVVGDCDDCACEHVGNVLAAAAAPAIPLLDEVIHA